MVKMQIRGLPDGLLCGNGDSLEAIRVSIDPENRYAVAELAANELFVALRILSREEDKMVGSYVDHYRYRDADVPALTGFTVLWDHIGRGFCKLDLWAPEGPVQATGGFHRTVKRFYFDRERYEACREARRGKTP